MSNPEIIVKNADKGGGGVVILNKEDYLEESLWILSDDQYYRKLTVDPSKSFTVYHSLINKDFEDSILNKKRKLSLPFPIQKWLFSTT